MCVERGIYKTSKTNCCVVGCSNNYINAPPGTQFYSFPNGKKYPGRKEKWISAIKRQSTDGTLWKHSKYSKVCSVHFYEGKKSEHPQHPSFVPTIMPSVYKKETNNVIEKVKRFERRRKFNARQLPNVNVHVYTSENDESIVVDNKTSQDISIQTDPVEVVSCDGNIPVLFCGMFENNSFTQTNIPIHVNTDHVIQKAICLKPSTKNQGCGPDAEECKRNEGFHGFKSVQNEDELSGLGGVTRNVFDFLLGHLKKKISLKINKENRLLLFLMKMKIGLTFAALGVLFDVHRTTASRNFFSVLEELAEGCKDLIFWPSKFAIRATLPSVFSDYTNIRSIIDCTEIRTEKPPRVDEQICMYSSYKSHYTVKVLISITPNGFISFLSKSYGGRATDAYITQTCGFLDLLDAGDTVMADKGFPLIINELENKCVKLVMPPFATSSQFSKEDNEETYKIAKVRIHVERCIGRVKSYRILEKNSCGIIFLH